MAAKMREGNLLNDVIYWTFTTGPVSACLLEMKNPQTSGRTGQVGL